MQSCVLVFRREIFCILAIAIASETQLTSKYEKEGCQLWIL
ncbi:hypothetical protein [Nostoc sp.]